MKPAFISLDGVDGVGKTTVAKILAADESFQYYKSPSGPYARLREEVDKHANAVERYCFYRLATQFDSVQIGLLLQKGPVISDRYIYSTAAYHFAMDERIRDIHNEDGLLKPDFAFLLSARPDVRWQRMVASGRKARSDAAIEEDGAFLDRVAEVFRSLDLIDIDTSDMSAEEVVSTIKHIMVRGGRR